MNSGSDKKEEPKIEKKEEEKPKASVDPKENMPQKSDSEDFKAKANYLVEVFGFSFEKCLKWAYLFPNLTKEELLNYCLAEPAFYN
jgi:hypothetical protein